MRKQFPRNHHHSKSPIGSSERLRLPYSAAVRSDLHNFCTSAVLSTCHSAGFFPASRGPTSQCDCALQVRKLLKSCTRPRRIPQRGDRDWDWRFCYPKALTVFNCCYPKSCFEIFSLNRTQGSRKPCCGAPALFAQVLVVKKPGVPHTGVSLQ